MTMDFSFCDYDARINQLKEAGILEPTYFEHSVRTAQYLTRLYSWAVENGLLHEEHTAAQVFVAGLLHDIGKCYIPNTILQKNGPLSDAEYAAMMLHCVSGAAALKYQEEEIRKIFKADFDFELVLSVIYAHHERVDGKGYPFGLHGKNIPLLAKLCAVADTFDAITSDRPYRKGKSFEEALKIISDCAGTQLDAIWSAAFCKCFEQNKTA